MKFFIIHGAYGNPDGNWFPWLKKKLEEQKDTVFVPKFSTPEKQSLKTWTEEFDDFYFSLLDNDSVLIGHSIGCAFILSVLERIKEPVNAVIFVAGFSELLNNSEVDGINKTFVKRRINWEKIKKNCKNFYVLHSDNDPYVPLKLGEDLARNLGGELILIKNAGHFNIKAGFKEFPFLFDLIQNNVKGSNKK